MNGDLAIERPLWCCGFHGVDRQFHFVVLGLHGRLHALGLDLRGRAHLLDDHFVLQLDLRKFVLGCRLLARQLDFVGRLLLLHGAIGLRFLQALGCCAAVMIARAVVRDAYEPQDSAKLLARASTWISLAPIVGPILGSYLQVAFGWRAAFGALGTFSACVMAACILRLPETNEHKNPDATNLRGLADSYRLVLGSREFWLNVMPGALSYGGIFMFISGSSFAARAFPPIGARVSARAAVSNRVTSAAPRSSVT